MGRYRWRSRLLVGLLGLATLSYWGSAPVGAKLPGPSQVNAAGLSLFVAPWGNDRNPGTRSRPFGSLLRARSAVRALNQHMTNDITIHLEAGTYALSKPFELQPQDSGTNGHSIIWSGPDSGAAVISGAVPIKGWHVADRSKNVWEAPVPKGLQTRQLYVNGLRASTTAGLVPVKLTQTWYGYVAASPLMSHWRNPRNIQFVYYQRWGQMDEQICPIGSIKGKDIHMAQPCWYNSTQRRSNQVGTGSLSTSPAYIQNAFELLNSPGQFYLDQSAHELYYIPRSGQNMSTADVEAPLLQTLVQGNGRPGSEVHNITFSNLQFSYATWLQPSTSEGFSEIQANFTLTGDHGYAVEGLCHLVPHGACPYGAWTKEPGNVSFSYDNNIAFINDRFVHLGATGLNLGNGSQRDVVEGSVFTDISGNGLDAGSVNMPRAKGANQTVGITIENNHLYGLPVEYHGGIPIFVGYAADVTVTHNQIDQTPYTAISLGWGGWLDKIGEAPVRNFSHGNSVSNNLIFDYMEVMGDGGAVYTLGPTGTSMKNGERVAGNVIHDQLDWSFALHSDNGASYVTYANNVLYHNTYDWGTNHIDYMRMPRQDDPQIVTRNYWQQGNLDSPDFEAKGPGNKIIDGPGEAPMSITAAAGIAPPFRSILSWEPSTQCVPTPPQRVSVLYAYQRDGYVTWHPSFTSTTCAVTGYTVRACPVSTVIVNPCSTRDQSTTISESDYRQLGYAEVSRLNTGQRYIFTVVANSTEGPSTPSVPSAPVSVAAIRPRSPSRPMSLSAHGTHGAVRLVWYPPRTVSCTEPWFQAMCKNPVLAYKVTDSAGETRTITGLSQMFVSNHRGHVLYVFDGLAPGNSYRFSISAVGPTGSGQILRSSPIQVH